MGKRTQRVSVENVKERKILEDLRTDGRNNIKMDLQ